MHIKTEKDKIKIEVLLTTQGKYRCKERPNIDDVGISHSSKKSPFSDKCYIEWQIGYDVKVDNTNNDKQTSLTKHTFIGANGNEKYPYELSEILYFSIKKGIVSIAELTSLESDIKNLQTDFEVSFPLIRNRKDSFIADGFEFIRNDIEMPTFAYFYPDGTGIEISIQKQQYAVGVQPMLYLCIPITCLENASSYIGRCAKSKETGNLIIDLSNKKIILDMFKMFAQLSIKHKHDILEIINIIKMQDQ